MNEITEPEPVQEKQNNNQPKPQPPPDTQSENKPIGETDVGVNMADDWSSDDDFRETFRTILCISLDRMCQALEYEKEAFLEIATARQFNSYFQLANSGSMVAALKATFDIASADDAKVDPGVHEEQQKFRALVTAATTAAFKNPSVSKEELVQTFQGPAKAMQDELKDSVEHSKHSDLKYHLLFMGSCLDVLQGDLAGNPALLYQNIDTFVASSHA
jgi:hypothetical protein